MWAALWHPLYIQLVAVWGRSCFGDPGRTLAMTLRIVWSPCTAGLCGSLLCSRSRFSCWGSWQLRSRRSWHTSCCCCWDWIESSAAGRSSILEASAGIQGTGSQQLPRQQSLVSKGHIESVQHRDLQQQRLEVHDREDPLERRVLSWFPLVGSQRATWH